MKSMRQYSVLDSMVIRFDDLLHAAKAGKIAATRPNPAESVTCGPLTSGMTAVSAGLMRVNHAGEVSAQALYQGQGIAARTSQVRQSMKTAADEEVDHLVWCRQRLQELGSHTSYLNPFWYLGSLSLGIIAGLAGDRWSLGFIAETEQQVVRHIDTHLAALPALDHKSRAILEQMRIDESRHATVAVESGATELPPPVKKMMRLCSQLMTKTAYWI